MHTCDVVLITEDRYAHPVHIDTYIANILEDDAILTAALNRHDLQVQRVSWSNPTFDWSSARCAVFRTTWDYFHKFDAFNNWLDSTSLKTRFINDLTIVRWNLDKHYLADLQRKGVHIVDTTFIEQGANTTLHALFEDTQQHTAIIKPAVSGAARHTYRITPDQIEHHEPVFQSLIRNEAMLFQPFQDDIVATGEISCMVMDGRFTHAVLKKAKQNDFRVQDDFGGTVHTYSPDAEEIAFAERAVQACPGDPLYARVDIVRDNHGQLAVMELELIEPELWLRKNHSAAAILADSIYQSLQ